MMVDVAIQSLEGVSSIRGVSLHPIEISFLLPFGVEKKYFIGYSLRGQ